MGTGTAFGENIVAMRGNVAGLSIRDVRTAGLDPQGWRAFSELRLEGGMFSPTADSVDTELYSRAALDLTVSRGFGQRAAASLTVGAGISDKAPVQRQFLLGGTETVRGQRPGTQGGDSYWLTRLEIGRGIAAARGVVFGDIGWAGPRSMWSHPGRPMSGAGVGMSFMDGLIRADLARGIYPSKRYRFDLYLEARF
jgi:hemolysin activation/secretion protein